MRKIYKLLLVAIASGFSVMVSAQENYWSSRSDVNSIATDKAVTRQSFPKAFKTFELNLQSLKQQLFTVVDRAGVASTIISIPNADGSIEKFQVFEASNFDAALQARFPLIRAFSGRGLDDKSALLKLSIAPNGIQTMVFRADGKPNEYIEPYSADHTVYAVFKSQRAKGGLPWVCSTADQELATGLQNRVNSLGRTESSAGELKTMRLAQSVTAEYSNFFGATSAAQSGLVLAAVNATMTRTNGCYEKDLALHLNLIANTTAVFYYDPATDPYTFPISNWNTQLGNTLAAIIGEANYDIGHLFGQSGGGGNAGCIGCVCVDNQKGRGITSPADGIPQGDNFDIDYVAHEIGHQLGGNHTFSMSTEGTGVNKEVGSGITIMGYAGITGQDVAPHSIDIFHQASIQQIQVNLAGKTCPITTTLAGINATPIVAPLTNITIPRSTPFTLTGSATDADAGDVLTYCWEQNDNGTAATTGAASVASPTKTVGPNWLSFSPTTSPSRLMPRLSTILAGLQVTGPLPGGDAGANIEALSSVARILNFRVTARDNRPYNGTAVGQTSFADMVVTVDGTTGPFQITSQNTAVTYDAGSSQTIAWDVNGTTGAPINCSLVKISFSTDGGVTFPFVLAASTANDGTEMVNLPGTTTTTGRVKVEAIGNVFFDINNASITLTVPPVGFTFGATTPATAVCPAPATMAITLPVVSQGGYVEPVTLSATGGVPAGTTISFGTNPVTPSGSSVITLSNTNSLAPGTYNVSIQGTAAAPAVTQTATITFTVSPGSGPAITGQPSNQVVCVGNNATFTVAATGTYQWQVSTVAVPAFTNISTATAATLNLTAVTAGMNGNQYRCIVTGQCGSTTSSPASLTVNIAPTVTTNPTAQSVCSGNTATFTAAGTGTPAPTYQWQVSTIAIPAFTNIATATSATYTTPGTTVAMNGNQYRCVISNPCGSVNTTAATLSVSSSVTITTNPTPQTICEGTNTSFTVAAGGSGLSYQWQVSTDGVNFSNLAASAVYGGVTAATLTLTAAPSTLNGTSYRAIVSSGVCTPGVSTAALLTVNTFPVITAQPTSVTICEGASAAFSVTATTGVGSLSYQWQLSTNGGTTWTNIAGATTTSFSQTNVPATQNGYRFRLAVTAGCGTTNSNAAILTVNTFPIVAFGDIVANICKSDAAITLSASPTGGVWSGLGVTGSTFSPLAAGVGVRTVTYTVTNAGCVTAQPRVINVLECAERHLRLPDYQAVFVYPNPNTGLFSIRLNTDLYTRLGARVFGTDGRMYLSQVFTGVGYGSIIPIDISKLASGTYQVFLYNDEGGFDKKAVSIIVYK